MLNIKKFLSEKKKIVSILVIATLILTIICSGVRYEAAVNPSKENKDELNILVVNPGNNTSLNSSRTKIKTHYNNNDKNVTVNVTSVSMPQFIGQVDQLNGKYDAVAITRNNVTGQDTDYTNPFTPYDMFDTGTSDDKSGVPIPEGFKNAYGPGTPDSYRIKNGIKTSSVYGERTYVEYYSENDITNKRANEILEMIKSGQLAFFDNDIFNRNDLQNTKLVKNFGKVSGNNVVKTNRSEITVQNIVDKYFNDNVVKEEDVKPKITVTSITKGTKDTFKEADRKINAEFTVNTGNAVQDGDKVKIDLYLDFNGDTLFRGTDLVYSTYGIVNKGEVKCTINYEMTKEFVGQLDWKIEVSTFKEDGYEPNEEVESNIRTKSYVTGNITYINSVEKKKIKVLQIVPDTSSLLNLSNDSRMQKFLSGSTNDFLNSYDISVDYKKISEVNKINNIDDSYTMIIFGFADTYGGSSDLSEDMVIKLKEFVQKGKSVMFTHDTMPINIESAGNINQSVTGPKRLAQFFRDYIGQARYIDPMRKNEEENIYRTFTPVYNSEGKVDEFKREFKKIPHDNIEVHEELRSQLGDTTVYSYGYTDPILKRVRVNNGFVIGKSNEGELYNQPYMVLNTAVNELNEGSITSYPYNLPDSMYVARTHNQWYQLNLEDEDVVPWYTLDPSKIADNTVSLNNGGAYAGMFRTYDARNYYYTYSKGNITYSGTGHSDGFTDDELRLFVNTIIKADRTCNHPPTLEAKKKEGEELLELKNNMETAREDDLTLNIIPKDIDIGDTINVTIEAYVGDGNENSWEKLNLSDCNFSKKSEEKFDFTISKVNYSREDISKIKVVIKGSDGKVDSDTIENVFNIVTKNNSPILKAIKVEGDNKLELINEMYTDRYKDIDLEITPIDIDINDFIDVNIKVEKNSVKEPGKWTEVTNTNYEKRESNQTIDYSISKDYYEDDEDVTQIKITITGKDSQNAPSNTIENIFNLTDPKFDYNLEHGLFDDYSFENPGNGDAIRGNVELVSGTYGTFATQYKYRDSTDTVTIDVDTRIKDINNMVAYKIDGNKLIKVSTIGESINGSKIQLRINDSKVSKGDTVIIKYSGYIPEYNTTDNNVNNLKSIATITNSEISSNSETDDVNIYVIEKPDLY